MATIISGRWIRWFAELMQNAHTTKHHLNCKCHDCLTSANHFPLLIFLFVPQTVLSFLYFLSMLPILFLKCVVTLHSLYYPTVFCPFASFWLHLQSNSLLSESLRNSDKRRNGPEFPNDTKKRKVDDKDSSHYVRNCSSEYVCLRKGFRKEKII